MRFNDNDRKELWVTTTTNVDPGTATLHLTIDDTEYACTWDAAATEVATGRWQRTAHTDDAFAGPGVAEDEIAGATALTAGHHEVEILLRVGGRILAFGHPGFTVQ